MINKISSKKNVFEFFLVISFLCYIAVTTILLFEWTLQSSFVVQDNDGYITNFLRYLETGFYQSNVNGTTVVYYFVLSLFYRVFEDVQLCFFLVNVISQFFMLAFGVFMILKLKPKLKENRFIFYIVICFFCFRTLILTSYNKASNDTFFGVFIMMVLYLLLFRIYPKKKLENCDMFSLGFLLAVCLGIRLNTILLLPVISAVMIVGVKNISYKELINKIILLVCTFIAFTSFINFPSMKEKGKLSFYNKNHVDYNWTQRNFLAIKKIEENNESFNSGNVWKTKFEDVKVYLETNGAGSLPESLSEVIFKYPKMYLKVVVLNSLAVVGYFIRFTGVFLLLPLLYSWGCRNNIISNIPFLSLIIYSFCLLSVVFTKVEFRWFSGYEILIYLSIVYFMKNYQPKNINLAYSITTLSLILVCLFNLRSIIYI